ncbi:thiolase family protein [Streptomyces melanosporofaciens]|uniref:Acetyl-CoA acetyltransferase n=1 Tax=Streptomyces melanosporofaciens TaxID=67327 RepID=A0A1H4IAX8_STRMJ|nr:thiolase family protein [Streptomyces melanosporofaciens]SEB30422.1 Acetyl-CoA acetyltransferase [Streptomyces melanosporofaciens]
MATSSWPGGAAAVVGLGSTEFGHLPGCSADDLGLRALVAAMADAELAPSRIDGLVASRVSGYETMAARAGIEPRWSLQLPAEGRMTGPAIQSAVLAIAAGMCTTVALVYGNNGKSGRHTYGGEGASSSAAAEGYGTVPELTRPYGMTSPGAYYALMLQRHRAQFGTSEEQLATVATTFRRHAGLNPSAVLRTPLTTEDYLDSRYVVKPMHLFDYCLINDGGVAMIITRADIARDLPHRPVHIVGFGQRGRLRDSDYPPEDYWHAAIGAAGGDTYHMAGREREDVDALMVYDNFSPNVLFSLEGLGFCEPGESGAWIQDGRIGLGGELPLNTSGGHLSESYMQGWALNVEAVRQLRGECGPRQVEGASCVQYVAAAPIVSSILYGTEA